ncbi:secondary thiamine-phosphate synthase enzyme YjbQ [Dechloromonas denitrificans]|uniref:secondary thiamine-phosphate synthase enzyme YjbQ n=1 Tax=Dechloromonas denitrificans TaxID=281362 RepID=UPI001CF8BE93|nr:secondary thiamine-phosphate synthase enzyme YjbQ [Dechloromonas denitrificans]UCV01958.1 secondary thiamine-phosphate synthase enzyme YjbQ [Dechloromonas denitrificans]UCV06292.1 secondary thiamine-phosphate synthase enzyme YjbQ [Dechloromonas denitrificans]
MSEQHHLTFNTHGRGAVEITDDIAATVRSSALAVGVAHVFVRHTSCGLAITENADGSVRRDLETLMQRWAPDGDPDYHHDLEGDDDMAAHARSLLTGTSVSVPFADGRLQIGTWQGIYLFEHRTRGHRREIVVTLLG